MVLCLRIGYAPQVQDLVGFYSPELEFSLSNSHNPTTKSELYGHETALSTSLTEPYPHINIQPPKSSSLSVKTSQLGGNNEDQKSTLTTKPRIELAITSQQGV